MSPRIDEIRARLEEIEKEKCLLLGELERLSVAAAPSRSDLFGAPALHKTPATEEERISLFKKLFCCRDDVFPKLWESKKKGTSGYSPVCKVEWLKGLCGKPRVKCSECRNKTFSPFDESVIRNHLDGKATVGTYTIREDDTSIFLAADFDGDQWNDDAMAFKAAAKDLGVEVSVERSRSGEGGHAWIFFSEPVAARAARQLGTLILTHAMTRRHHIGFDTYDRFFPSQDTLPKGGFGNLIALPFQKVPAVQGNSLFIDDNLNPYQDQWEFLSRVRLLSDVDVAAFLRENSRSTTLEISLGEADPDVLDAEASLSPEDGTIRGLYQGSVFFYLSRHLEIDLRGLPSRLIAAFKRATTFANPKFFELQRMRFSTWNTPRYISTAEQSDGGERMIVPRGLLAGCRELCELAGADVVIKDLRRPVEPVPISFIGELLPAQETALRDLIPHDSGVLVAPPGAGKTVIACALMAERRLPTLVLVHRKQLADQWTKQLLAFTDLSKDQIRAPGGKETEPQSIVHVAMLQTLARDQDGLKPLSGYGQVIVDECHHVPAVSFESVLKRIDACHFLGLTATPYRKDGLEKIIAMHCGPVLHTMGETKAQSLIEKRVIVKETAFRMDGEAGPQPALHEIWQALISDEDRLRLVASDVALALKEGRFPLVLSDRKDHLELLLGEITTMTGGNHSSGFLMTSETGTRMRNHMIGDIRAMLNRGECPFLLSTGSLIGEGFDLPELSALVLAMPLSFKGRLVQYAGRLHRESSGKDDVVIYDYVDKNLPLCITMFKKRLATYRKMNYVIEAPPGSKLDDLVNRKRGIKRKSSASFRTS